VKSGFCSLSLTTCFRRRCVYEIQSANLVFEFRPYGLWAATGGAGTILLVYRDLISEAVSIFLAQADDRSV